MYEVSTIGGVSASDPARAISCPSSVMTIGDFPYVTEGPYRAVLTAGGIGLVVGLVLGALFLGGRRG